MVAPSVPRLVIAAPSSGSGKTTFATGLMAAFTQAGLAVSPHKVGPDYIDPGYHALATGRPGRNLDAYLCGPDRVAPLFLHGARGAGLAVVEGVMGLFDGAARSGCDEGGDGLGVPPAEGRGRAGGTSGDGEQASTAQVAKLLRAPVVLVVDASSQSRSVAALVHGFASWDPQVRLGGVILNKVGSDRHEELLREALDASGVPVLGVLRRERALEAPSRHLGLVPVAERHAQALAAVAALAARVRAGCDLPALLELARSAPPLAAEPWDPGTEVGGFAARPVVAMAGGAAFTFSYAEHAELLAAAGARVAVFDPLRDEALPEGARGLVVGGGFPEVYGPELSANEPLREAVAGFDGPVAAECAGLLYLARELDGRPMCGVLDVKARMSERLTLGYREAVAVSDSVLTAAGVRLRGHEFHRTVVEPGAGTAPAWGLTRPERRVEGFVQGGVHASYLHVHWAGEPSLARRFVKRCVA